jgi:hypothetical protein
MPTPRQTVVAAPAPARPIISLPKSQPRRSQAYLRWVSSLHCAHCGKAPPNQACHSDEGKGLGIKSGDDSAWPGCADSPGRVGCHSIVGSSGLFTRDQRRTLEATRAADTRERARRTGNWPKEWA